MIHPSCQTPCHGPWQQVVAECCPAPELEPVIQSWTDWLEICPWPMFTVAGGGEAADYEAQEPRLAPVPDGLVGTSQGQ